MNQYNLKSMLTFKLTKRIIYLLHMSDVLCIKFPLGLYF